MSLRPVLRIPLWRTSPHTPQLCKLSTSPIFRLKEGANKSPEQLEQTKNEQFEKAKKGKGEWHEDLASAGEANIKADKQHVKDHDDHIEQLQKETAKKGEKGTI